MEILFPASMLVIGLIIGGLLIWFTTRSKVKPAAGKARTRNMISYMQHLLLD